MRRALDAGTFRHHHRLFKGVVKLPVKIVFGYIEQGTRLSGWIYNLVRKVLAAKMHVRHHSHELGIASQRILGFHFVIRIARRNLKIRVRRVHGQLAPFRLSFIENQPELSLVGRGGSVGGVVDF